MKSRVVTLHELQVIREAGHCQEATVADVPGAGRWWVAFDPDCPGFLLAPVDQAEADKLWENKPVESPIGRVAAAGRPSP